MNTLPHATEPVAHNIDKDLLRRYSKLAADSSVIDPELYRTFNVKRGLRNADGSGVLVGLTTVGSVVGYTMFEQELQPVPGRLFFRGVELRDLVHGFQSEHRFGFEETVYLLLFGKLPTASELDEFRNTLDRLRPLPHGFKEEAILGLPSPDVMNKLARCVLASYTEDPTPDSTAIENVVRQSLTLISRFPTFAVYGYQAKAHYYLRKSLHMRIADPGLSTAEHILNLLRPHGKFTRLEAELLDLCLVIHAEHGGGNNSTFTTHVVSSTYTDTYSAIAAACLSLKGPRHGGANLQVRKMMEQIKSHVKDWRDEGKVADYLRKILEKKVGDRRGLIYGLGHAVYKVSDPRAELLREKAAELVAANPEFEPEFALHNLVAKVGDRLFREKTGSQTGLCPNVDFYSGFVYKMLGIPQDLFTPLFAVGRVPGWCAHRIEELNGNSRIIRPAYKCVLHNRAYVPLAQR
ncbi:MAG: citrate/2-methylcitrate synthase [Kiritimatiellae bacterium]|nr:citrate/2-methylcitrate synthase [Kiritimatiellia bacterium]